ncbi:GTPase IMAP family member 4-like isoform X2 [Lepisosteus oculatus]|uniref:GTPase IMAP family member 4-like n=1 Tax=Lepisosteus oculatus TaxID=7918 RepID=W5NIB5_LEPOC|nr:PREDICTED: GTPase IMAP family member 4-like isoform X2 [Lepisosteus oculatus]
MASGSTTQDPCERIQEMVKEESVSELKVVLLGLKQAGKSSAINTLLGGEGVESEREIVGEKRQGKIRGKLVTLIDTPGWEWDSEKVNSEIKEEIMRSVSLCSPGPHAFLLVIPVVSFKDSHRKAVEEHMHLLSERVWTHTIVLFTYGDKLRDLSIEQHIMKEGEGLQGLVAKCGNRYHVLNNKNISDHAQVTVLLQKIEEMVAEKEGEAFISEEVLQEVERRLQQQKEMLEQRKDEMEEEIKLRYEEKQKAIEEELRHRYEDELRKREEEMKRKLQEERDRKEHELKEKNLMEKELEKKVETSRHSIKRRNSMDNIPPKMSGDADPGKSTEETPVRYESEDK